MSESGKTNELDNFGVWVKKPPRTISTDETSPSTETAEKTSDAGDNVMDNKMEDIDIDSFLDGADFSDGSTSETEEHQAAAPVSSDGTEEVSLDEFLDGGVFESDDGGSAASAKSEEESKAVASLSESESVPENVPIEDFGSDSNVTVSESEPSVSSSDDGPLDIDLSFDDMPSDNSSNSSEPQFETIDSFDSLSPATESSGIASSSSSANSDGTESVDLSDFGFDINAPESSSEEKSEEAQTEEGTSSSNSTNDDGTESVDLSDFGFDINAPENPEEEKAPESQPVQKTEAESFTQETAGDISSSSESAPKTDENGMEEISLDDFGFDINAPEGGNQSEEKPAENAQTSEEEAAKSEQPANEEITEIDDISLNSKTEEEKPEETENVDLDSLSLDNSSSAQPAEELPETNEMSVKADDDMETEQNSGSENPDQNFKADDDDFDLDSIMDSIEDENGGKVSLSTKEDLVKYVGNVPIDELKEEPQPENIDDLNLSSVSSEEIPDSFDEETASLFADEPEDSEDNQSEPENPQNDKIAVVTDGKDEEIASSTNAILNKIVSELASLKSEISGLKNEFDEIKSKENKNHPEEKELAPEQKDEISPKAEAEINTGFFSENGEDDTIALSVDELDNILNSAEMVDDTPETSVPENQDNEALEKEEKSDDFEPSCIEETISENTDDLLPDYTDDEEEKEDDIFVPKAEEIEEAQSPIDFGSAEDETAEGKAPDLASDDLSIGDFSFDDNDNGTKTEETESEKQDEIQPDETLSDDVFNSIEPSNPVIPDSSDDDTIVDESSQTVSEPEPEEATAEKQTVDEPFDFGAESESGTTEEEVPVEVAPENAPVEDNNIAISNEELDNLLAPDPSIDESLTDENLNYLAADKEIENGKDEAAQDDSASSIPGNLKKEIKSVLSYMDQLLENLPEDKIAEFAQSEQFETYKKLFKELGLDNQ